MSCAGYSDVITMMSISAIEGVSISESEVRSVDGRRVRTMDDILKVAMPKGRIYKQAAKLFHKAGLPIPEDLEEDAG